MVRLAKHIHLKTINYHIVIPGVVFVILGDIAWMVK